MSSRGIFAAPLAALLLSSCSPYVNRIDHTYEPTPGGTLQFAGGLGVAIDDVSKKQVELSGKAGDQARLQNGLVFTLIPISAAAIYHSVRYTGEGTRGLVAKLGLTGAGIYGIGSLLRNPEREQLYLLGSQALGCAILSMRPFLLTKTEFDAFAKDLLALDHAVVNLETALQTAKASSPNAAQQAEISSAETTLAAAKKVLAEGNSLYAQVSTSGMFLRERANDLVAQVNVQIGRTQPDPSQILRVAGGLTQVSASLTTVSPATAPSTAKPAAPSNPNVQNAPLTPPPSDLRQKATAAAAATIPVAVVVNRSAELAKTVQAISECKAPTAQGVLVLSTEDRELNFTKKDETREFAILKVQGQPRHALTGGYQGSTRPFSVNVTFTEGIYRYAITATTDGPAEMQLAITDDAGLARRTIALKQAAKAAPAAGAADPQHFLAEGFTLTEAQIKTLQQKVGVTPQSGKLDDDTIAKVKAYAVKQSLAKEEPKQLDKKLYDAIVQKAKDDAAKAAVDKFLGDLKLTKDQVSALQKKIGMPAKLQTGTFGTLTMEAVRNYAVEHNLAAAVPANLTRDLYDKILGANPGAPKADAGKADPAAKK